MLFVRSGPSVSTRARACMSVVSFPDPHATRSVRTRLAWVWLRQWNGPQHATEEMINNFIVLHFRMLTRQQTQTR